MMPDSGSNGEQAHNSHDEQMDQPIQGDTTSGDDPKRDDPSKPKKTVSLYAKTSPRRIKDSSADAEAERPAPNPPPPAPPYPIRHRLKPREDPETPKKTSGSRSDLPRSRWPNRHMRQVNYYPPGKHLMRGLVSYLRSRPPAPNSEPMSALYADGRMDHDPIAMMRLLWYAPNSDPISEWYKDGRLDLDPYEAIRNKPPAPNGDPVWVWYEDGRLDRDPYEALRNRPPAPNSDPVTEWFKDGRLDENPLLFLLALKRKNIREATGKEPIDPIFRDPQVIAYEKKYFGEDADRDYGEDDIDTRWWYPRGQEPGSRSQRKARRKARKAPDTSNEEQQAKATDSAKDSSADSGKGRSKPKRDFTGVPHLPGDWVEPEEEEEPERPPIDLDKLLIEQLKEHILKYGRKSPNAQQAESDQPTETASIDSDDSDSEEQSAAQLPTEPEATEQASSTPPADTDRLEEAPIMQAALESEDESASPLTDIATPEQMTSTQAALESEDESASPLTDTATPEQMTSTQAALESEDESASPPTDIATPEQTTEAPSAEDTRDSASTEDEQVEQTLILPNSRELADIDSGPSIPEMMSELKGRFSQRLTVEEILDENTAQAEKELLKQLERAAKEMEARQAEKAQKGQEIRDAARAKRAPTLVDSDQPPTLPPSRVHPSLQPPKLDDNGPTPDEVLGRPSKSRWSSARANIGDPGSESINPEPLSPSAMSETQSTDTPSDEAANTDAPSTETVNADAPSTEAVNTDASSADAPSTEPKILSEEKDSSTQTNKDSTLALYGPTPGAVHSRMANLVAGFSQHKATVDRPLDEEEIAEEAAFWARISGETPTPAADADETSQDTSSETNSASESDGSPVELSAEPPAASESEPATEELETPAFVDGSPVESSAEPTSAPSTASESEPATEELETPAFVDGSPVESSTEPPAASESEPATEELENPASEDEIEADLPRVRIEIPSSEDGSESEPAKGETETPSSEAAGESDDASNEPIRLSRELREELAQMARTLNKDMRQMIVFMMKELQNRFSEPLTVAELFDERSRQAELDLLENLERIYANTVAAEMGQTLPEDASSQPISEEERRKIVDDMLNRMAEKDEITRQTLTEEEKEEERKFEEYLNSLDITPPSDEITQLLFGDLDWEPLPDYYNDDVLTDFEQEVEDGFAARVHDLDEEIAERTKGLKLDRDPDDNSAPLSVSTYLDKFKARRDEIMAAGVDVLPPDDSDIVLSPKSERQLTPELAERLREIDRTPSGMFLISEATRRELAYMYGIDPLKSRSTQLQENEDSEKADEPPSKPSNEE